ncbi:hypothetical protein [uncultured Polaribacter sp.]|uniref:hypothetical protein n=1 Tax=uncultured Polaribacter sp. TaxID=174711 RepID=UPI0026073DCE|nr:hypothetical protein [uncultured Polaribacter sp.]
MNKAVKYTYITIGINLLIAILIFLWLLAGTKNPIKDLVDFILDFPLNFGLGITALFISGYYIGNKMQSLICQRKWNSILVGMFGLMIILICGVFGGSTIGFIEEGLANGDSVYDAIVDYYYKPFFWILIFGFIPTFIAGGILGGKIKKTCYNNVYNS